MYAKSWKRCVQRTPKKRDSVSTRLKQNMTQTITKHTRVCKRKARIVCGEHFISLNRLMNVVVKVLLKCGIRSSTSFRWYTFPNFRTQISHPLPYGVRTSSKPVARPLCCSNCLVWGCSVGQGDLQVHGVASERSRS